MTVLLMAATAMVLAILLFWLSARSRKRTGIPAGEVFYQDLVGQPFRSTGPTFRKTGHLRKTRLLNQNCGRDRPGRIEEIEASTGSRRGVSQSYDPEPGLWCTRRRSDEGARSVWLGRLRGRASSTRGIYRIQPQMAHARRSLLFRPLGYNKKRCVTITNGVAAPDAACVTSVIRPCVEGPHRGLSIRHDRMPRSHACSRGSAAIPHALEQTRILPGTGSDAAASDE